MCGIFAYSGPNRASDKIITGLKRLEYRGYDSWGLALINQNGSIEIEKTIGEIPDIDVNKLEQSTVGIGHTRWATHGGVTKTNAHPHRSSDKKVAIAHNGIVENYSTLKNSLIESGVQFDTETDTEVILKLIEHNFAKNKTLLDALYDTYTQIEGRNTIILLDSENETIYTVKRGSPLVIGFSDNVEEIYFSSDTYSFSPWVKKIIILEDDQIGAYEENSLTLYNLNSRAVTDYVEEPLDLENQKTSKEGHEHFMVKEIYESSYVVRQVVNQDRGEMDKLVSAITEAKNVYCVGSGTAGVAASQIAFYLRRFSGVNAKALVGAEASEYFDLFSKDDLLITPSQSGETADVLEVLEIAKKRGAKIASHVNMLGSTITRLSDYKFLANAGPEISVMSTKVFISQIAWGYLLGKAVQQKYEQGIENLTQTHEAIDIYLSEEGNLNQLKKLAKELIKKEHIFLLSKGQNLNIVNEGMIKIIEGSYKHAHAIPAGDLKHYAITLMEKGVPVMVVASEDEVKKDIINAANEVKSRGATVIGISSEDHPSYDQHIYIEECVETDAIINVIPLQMLAYYMAKEMGNNVDKPRNIAKSVTVK